MKDRDIYCEELAKGMEEKLFFFDHVDAKTIIDFGCADGQVSEAIAEHGGYQVIGYDRNPHLLPNNTDNVVYQHNWDTVRKLVHGNEPIAIYFSSIFHELLSFGEMGDVVDKMHEISPDYIIIRDMYITDEDKMKPVEESDIMQVMNMVNLRLVNSFVCNYGPLMSKGNFIHFMMKHRFAYNWVHEIKENYIAITDEDINFWKSNGEVVFEEHKPLPYYQEVFKIRYNYELRTPTHIKLVIKT